MCIRDRASVERNILCNSVDDIPNCDFFFGSVVSRGDLQIAISTAGQSPAFAQRLRREIDGQLPDDLGPWLQQLGQLRREVLEVLPSGEARKLLLHRLAQRNAVSYTHLDVYKRQSQDCAAIVLGYYPSAPPGRFFTVRNVHFRRNPPTRVKLLLMTGL